MRSLPWLVLCALPACGTRPAPAAEIVGLQGLQARIAEHKGRPLLVNFWAIW